MKRKFHSWIKEILSNFQGKYRKDIDLGVFDEILGIFIGFIYVRYFIEFNIIPEGQIAKVYISLLLSLVYILFFVILSHSANDDFKIVIAGLITIVSFTVFQVLAHYSSNLTYGEFLQLPEVEIFQVTWFACLAWFFLKYVAEKTLRFVQTFSIEERNEQQEDKEEFE